MFTSRNPMYRTRSTPEKRKHSESIQKPNKQQHAHGKSPRTPQHNANNNLLATSRSGYDSDGSSARRTASTEPPSSLAPAATTMTIASSPSKIDSRLDEAAHDAKKSSLSAMLREAKKRKREADNQLSSKEIDYIAAYEQDLVKAENLLEECDNCIDALEDFQVVIVEQQQTLRAERRKRLKTFKQAREAVKRAKEHVPATGVSETVQLEIELLEQKLDEI